MREAKRALRQRLRAAPGTGDSEALCAHILAHPWFQAAETVMAYMAMPTEPDLEPVLRAALALGKGLVLPRCDDGTRMTGRLVRDLGQLTPGPFGILEPSPGAEIVPPARIELVLTPGMAFDRNGGRLGRGKGYYDRFLAMCPGRTVGVCFQTCLLDRIPMEEYDHRMDAVATEVGVRLCGGDTFDLGS